MNDLKSSNAQVLDLSSPLSFNPSGTYAGTHLCFCQPRLSQGTLLLTWINFSPAWITNYAHYNVWDEIVYSFPNFNSAVVEAWEWMSNFISHLTVGWVGLWGFLWWAPSAKRKDHYGVSSGLSSVLHRSNTGLSRTQYEQIPIILGVWPFWLTPFFFRSITFWRAYG